ncbi:DNA primase [Rhodococcus kronopolitis]|uniref:DNA primase n=1 Tax=Rhodococcus kronopolitis TaxID=1460226 RepID=A0ABV9FS55_9NOCA
MAGRISERDIAAIRDRVHIEDIVGEYVALKRSGGDSMKGLCPFHDEKSPSFHARPSHGTYHCFGCGEGGDVYSFLQKIEHVSFVEAVEQLADRVGYTISYEGGGPSVQRDRGTRARLVAANAAAQAFYAARLGEPDAQTARDYLTERNFDGQAALTFGCGYAPDGWDTLTKHLMTKGFEANEIVEAGLATPGKRGTPIDRFRRRLVWPIRNLSGDVIGFGARKLFDDDTMPGKYINTPETMLYKKSQVLFGLDLAKREIAKGHQAVIVEGYTDVMAMHLAGVKTAVAACGTAFGEDHLAMLRRLLLDDSYFRGEVIYTFDGDAAGQAAALKAFEGDQKMSGQSFVAVAPDGMDPCELRQASGDAAVRDLVARRIPMFKFVVKSLLAAHDLETSEGRVEALRRTVPVVARIRDEALREDYARQLAGWVGWDNIPTVIKRVRDEARRGSSRTSGRGRPGTDRVAETADAQAPTGPPRPNPKDPALWPQRDALKAALQYPAIAGSVFDSLPAETFGHPAYAMVRQAVAAAGGTAAGLAGAEWMEAVGRQVEPLQSLVTELSVEPLRASDVPNYIPRVLARLQEVWVGQQVADLKSKLQRMSQADRPDEYMSLFGDLVALEQYRRSLLEQAVGDNSEDV